MLDAAVRLVRSTEPKLGAAMRTTTTRLYSKSQGACDEKVRENGVISLALEERVREIRTFTPNSLKRTQKIHAAEPKTQVTLPCLRRLDPGVVGGQCGC
jgi:hypothetical protein